MIDFTYETEYVSITTHSQFRRLVMYFVLDKDAANEYRDLIAALVKWIEHVAGIWVQR